MLQNFIQTAKLLLIGSVLVVLSAASLSATAVSGSFGTTGAGVMTFTSGGANFLDWCPTDPTSPAGSTCVGAAGYAKGDISASGGSGTFSVLPAIPGSPNGTIKDLTNGPSTALASHLPVGQDGTTLNGFLTLAALPNLVFQANNFVPVTCTPVPGVVLCAGGFVLTQVGPNVSVAISVAGIVWDTATPTVISAFSDVISGQYNNTTLNAVANAANTPAGVYSNTWSQSITATIPEPGTILLLGSGFLAFLPFARKRNR